MNGVMGLNGLLLRTDIDATQRNYLEIQRESSQELMGLLDNLLDTSQIESGKMEIEVEPFELEPLLQKLQRFLQSGAAQEKGLECRGNLGNNLPHTLLGDAQRLTQVLNNLCSNAIKFTDQGSIGITVATVEGEARNQKVLNFSVSDTGIGMSAEQQHQIFDLFTQADSSLTRRHGGSGLGLAISQQLVQMMGGAGIEVSSEVGVGSTFSFSLAFEWPH